MGRLVPYPGAVGEVGGAVGSVEGSAGEGGVGRSGVVEPSADSGTVPPSGTVMMAEDSRLGEGVVMRAENGHGTKKNICTIEAIPTALGPDRLAIPTYGYATRAEWGSLPIEC